MATKAECVWFCAIDRIPDGSIFSIIGSFAVAAVGFSVIVNLGTPFSRKDGESSFANTITGSRNLLSNKDSIMKRKNVEDYMDGYDELFTGARRELGSLQKEESIQKREKEYKTMVDNFYNLVTDFYEWGWGQVRFIWLPSGNVATKSDQTLSVISFCPTSQG
jgi:hypothetical protein